jgi:predicted RNA-binding protein
MATLKEIYNELELIMEDVETYVEEADNANLASDVAGSVKNPMEKLLSALDGIMDDESAGVYEVYSEDEFYEEGEEF